ncbi:FAD synthase [Patescibacteria group bacterium]|nr:MAG: FAD synthase [Patescibacteria group bacterium]
MTPGGRRHRVVAFGVFDLLHPGHLRFLEQARKLGTELVVVVTRDARARREKGRAPVLSEMERLSMVRALKCVDRAILGDKPGVNLILRRLKPEMIALGHDQQIPRGLGGNWRYVRLLASLRRRYSASNIRKALSRYTL